ncbi:hypothetical protein A4G99_19125 [Haladaptatus sp. R4]|uniref:hypothetical protein n=1 Tax=Haladaptatus sp. R4 TaxID=1679489 RepID=UPI0007B4CE17|nr:hypothetical protein [Haladaptatus sp. R4]KZN22578.1 hypothetical protein A4G99_19125 [Haladaptatus sp. R4]
MIQNRHSSWLLALFLVVLVASLAAPVAAQSASANNTTTSQNHWIGNPDDRQTTAPSNNSTSGANGGNDNGVLGGLGGGLVPSINPIDMAKGQLKAIAGIFLGVGKGIANMVRDSVAAVPAPGQPDKPSTWANPHNGLWPGVYKASAWTAGLASVALMAAFGMSFYRSDPYEKRQAWKRIGVAFVMVATTWIIPPLLLHLANETAMSVAPNGAEFIQTNSKLAKLGVGIGLGVLLGFIESGTIAVGILVLGLERALIYVCVFLWPLSWACRAYSGFLKSIGDTFVYLFGVVIVTKLFQALVLRLLADLPWTSGALGVLETFTLVVGGLVFALLILPKEMLAHANDAASITLGTSASNQRKAGKYVDEAGERVGHEVHEKVQEYRSDDSSWDQSDNSTFSTGTSAREDTVNYGSVNNALNADGGIDAQEAREEQECADYELNQGREILQRYD